MGSGKWEVGGGEMLTFGTPRTDRNAVGQPIQNPLWSTDLLGSAKFNGPTGRLQSPSKSEGGLQGPFWASICRKCISLSENHKFGPSRRILGDVREEIQSICQIFTIWRIVQKGYLHGLSRGAILNTDRKLPGRSPWAILGLRDGGCRGVDMSKMRIPDKKSGI